MLRKKKEKKDKKPINKAIVWEDIIIFIIGIIGVIFFIQEMNRIVQEIIIK
jgi:hypothetical protein